MITLTESPASFNRPLSPAVLTFVGNPSLSIPLSKLQKPARVQGRYTLDSRQGRCDSTCTQTPRFAFVLAYERAFATSDLRRKVSPTNSIAYLLNPNLYFSRKDIAFGYYKWVLSAECDASLLSKIDEILSTR